MSDTIDQLRALWPPDTVYLDTASYGLPPQPSWDALQAALADWRTGRTSWEGWSEATDATRRAFAALVRTDPASVATGATVSGLVGLIAAALPDGSRVLAPEREFASLTFPFLAQEARGVRVRFVALDRLAEAIDASTDVVVLSAVQSASGVVADVDEVTAAARHHGALSVVDGTQACGWLPLEGARPDALVCAGYKWLMAPRGTAFMAIRDALSERLVPHAAGWFAAEDVHGSYYAPPMRLAAGARRLDTSPAWFSWVGAAPALELLGRVGIAAIHAHDVGLANRFLAGLGRPPGRSAIVSVELPRARERLERAGIRAAVRDGRLRASFHLYNGEADVDMALSALVG